MQIERIDTASDVAELVSRAFSTTILNSDSKNEINRRSSLNSDAPSTQSTLLGSGSTNFMTGLFRLMGLDSSKLGALALNGLIFIAQMIGKMLLQPSHEKINLKKFDKNDDNAETPKSGLSLDSPMNWILNSENNNLNKLLIQVRDKNLPQNLINMVDNFEQRKGDGECIKLLLCKSAPFVWGMQRAIYDRIDGETVENEERIDKENKKNHQTIRNHRILMMFKYIPDLHEFKIHSDACEQKYQNCEFYN